MVRTLSKIKVVYDAVEEAGQDSFPASDPPSFTPVSGSGTRPRSFAAPGSSSAMKGVFREVDLDLLPPTGQVHLVLLEAEAFLAQALREWAAGGTDTEAEEVVGRLTSLRDYLSEHRANIAADGSLADSLKSDAPYLISHMHRLLRHHDELDRAIAVASTEFETTQNDTHSAKRLRGHARGIAASLTKLLGLERWLLMAQFCEPPALD